MYTITGIERLLNWVSDSGCSYYKIYDNDRAGDSRRCISDNFNVEKSTPEDCLRKIRQFVELYSTNGIRCYVWVVDKITNSKGGKYTWFEMSPMNVNTSNSVAGIGGTPSGYISQDEVDKKISEALERAEIKRKLSELENQNKLLQQEINESDGGAIGRIAERLEPFLPAIVSGIFGGSAPMGATQTKTAAALQINTQETQDDQEKKIAESLEKLYSNFPDLANILEKLANKNPDELKSLLQFL